MSPLYVPFHKGVHGKTGHIILHNGLFSSFQRPVGIISKIRLVNHGKRLRPFMSIDSFSTYPDQNEVLPSLTFGNSQIPGRTGQYA
jgi:hypothetical protein